MEIDKLKIKDLKPHPRNAKLHSRRNIDAIANSLEQFGQFKPIVVQKSSGYILAGNGTFMAAKRLKWKELDCHVVDVDDQIANALALADNKVAEFSEWNVEALSNELKELDDQTRNALGFDPEFLAALFGQEWGLEPSNYPHDDKVPGSTKPPASKPALHCPHCGNICGNLGIVEEKVADEGSQDKTE